MCSPLYIGKCTTLVTLVYLSKHKSYFNDSFLVETFVLSSCYLIYESVNFNMMMVGILSSQGNDMCYFYL